MKYKLIFASVSILIFSACYIFESKKSPETGFQNANSVSERKVLDKNNLRKVSSVPYVEKVVIASKPQHKEKILLSIQKYLLDKSDISRKSVLDEAYLHPFEFAVSANDLLSELPSEYQDHRKSILGVAIDVADLVNLQTSKMERESLTAKEFFKKMNLIVEREIQLPEIVESERIKQLSDYQKEAMVHSSILIEKNGQPAQSTFESKVVSLHLAARFPSNDTKQSIVDSLAQTQMDSKADNHTLDSLHTIAKDLLGSQK